MTRAFPIALAALAIGYHVGVYVGRAEHRSDVTRAIREADASHGRESQCMTMLVSTRSGLGLLVPAQGGIGPVAR